MNNIAKINQIPYLFFKFKEAKFKWEDRESLRGRLNGSLVQLKKLPLWVIFLLKTLPILLILTAISNNFFAIREFFKLDTQQQVFGLIFSATVIFMFYSVFFKKGGLQFLFTIVSIIIYIFLTTTFINSNKFVGGGAWELALGTALYLILIFFAFSDIIAILIGEKEMYYIKKEDKKVPFEGIFVSLYKDQIYLKEEAEDEYY